MNIYLKKLYYGLLLIADDKVSICPKIVALFKLVATFAPIAYVLDLINIWFITNKQFVVFVTMTIAINMLIGAWRHRKLATFKWEKLLIKTVKMMAVLISTYALLEMIRITAGDNILTNSFKVIIQVITIFYPASKALKSVFIISNGEYPPKWIMEKVYSFEKDGDVDGLFDVKKRDEEID